VPRAPPPRPQCGGEPLLDLPPRHRVGLCGGAFRHHGPRLDRVGDETVEVQRVSEAVQRAAVPRVVMERKETEVMALFFVAGLVLALASVLLSVLWFHRIL
jgi:hypothetical protein